MRKRLRYPNTLRYPTILYLSLHWQSHFPHLSSVWSTRQELVELSPSVREDQVHDYLWNLNIHKCMGSDKRLLQICSLDHLKNHLKSISNIDFNVNLSKCNLTKFDGKVHSIITWKGKLS